MIRNESRYKLFEIADAQAGYFTGQQAMEAGYSHAAQTYHLKQNHWRDEGWGSSDCGIIHWEMKNSTCSFRFGRETGRGDPRRWFHMKQP